MSNQDGSKKAEAQTVTATGERPVVPADVDPWIGKVLGGRYRVLERLGQGGMGTVYAAEHLTLHKQVALKLVHEADGSEAHAQRFVREAMVTSLIDHPNVISAIDFGTFDNGTAYLAMHLVRGPTLSRVIKDSGCMRWVRAADIGAQIADALCAAQMQGIVHRDLKPENVILQPMQDGTELVKLLDFGIAKHARDSLAPAPMQHTQSVTRVGTIVGTLGYMAPEQAVGKRADHRSDLYSLGALLWECIVGRKLWNTDDVQVLLAEQLNRPARTVRAASGDLSIPDALDRLVAKLLEINPADRPQSPAEVRDTLRMLSTDVKRGRLRSEEPSPQRRVPLMLEAKAQPAESSRGVDRGAATVVLGTRRDAAQATTQDAEALPRPPRLPSLEGLRLPPVELPASLSMPPAAAHASPTPSRGPKARSSLRASLGPKARTRAAFWAAAALALAAVAWTAGRAFAPEHIATATRSVTTTTPSAAALQPELQGDVRAMLKALIEGESREQRVAAAEALLRHVPVDEVPAYGRAMAHLQLAETCAQKREQLSAIVLTDDPRTLPMLIALSARKRSGCGPKGKDDCLACLRAELEALIARFEKMQLTRPRP